MIFGKGGYILCEGCSKQLNIVSDFSAICVCSTCGNVNQKHEPRISVAVGKMQEDVSVIQIGAKGTAQGSEILVTGRYRIETDSGYYNLWSVDVKKTGELAWLIDSMGEYIFASQHNHKYNALPEVKMWNSNTGKYFMLPALGSAKLITNKKVIYRNIEGEVGKMPLHIEH
ncbi:MAG: hypothetical protein JST49_08675, partial [Bacteroidetes bacterium]|nr:hypothetical protein [Bacteroidota bacterium]